MRLIESKTLGTAQASIEFTSIPQTFTDLYILASLRQTGSGFAQGVWLVNSATTNFSYRLLEGNGASTSSGNNILNYIGLINGSSSTSNTFASNAIYIANYSGATAKSISCDAVTETNATTSFQHITATLWNNTAAITSIRFDAASGNLDAGSMISLYGVLKGSDGIVTTSP